MVEARKPSQSPWRNVAPEHGNLLASPVRSTTHGTSENAEKTTVAITHDDNPHPSKNGIPLEVTVEYTDQKTAAVRGSGWKAAPFIFGSEMGEKAGSFGIQLNLVNYLLFELNMPLVRAANTVTNFFGITCLTTLGGAFLADAYLGSFITIAVSCGFYSAGLLVITLSAAMPTLRPPPCTMLQRFHGECQEPSNLHIIVLYISLALQCLGSGGLRPCVATFGADQFDKTNEKHKDQLRHYFNWYYMCTGLAIMLSLTVAVYIQDNIGWAWGAGFCAILMGLGTAIFLLGTPFYRHLQPTGSPLTSMGQVLVAAVRKHKRTLPANPDDLYKSRLNQDRESLDPSEEILTHTNNFRYLDKAAILEEPNEEPDINRRLDPWRLCTVQQVEELKILLRMFPVWLCTVIVATIIVQSSTFSVQQALSMDMRIGTFTIPPASMGIFSMLALLIFIPVYDVLLIKILRRFTGHPKGLSYLQRIGVGLFFGMLAMITASLVEIKRRSFAHKHNMVDQIPGSFLPISAYWLIPQYVLAGFSESFLIVGLLEFFYDEGPMKIRSMGNAFLWAAFGVGSFLSSILVSVIQIITKKNGQGGWLQNNINRGRLELFYSFLAILSFINLLAFYYISYWYVYKNTNIYNYHSYTTSSDSDKEHTDTLKP